MTRCQPTSRVSQVFLINRKQPKRVLTKDKTTEAYNLFEEIECTAVWCSVDNWQLLTCGAYFYRELKVNNEERLVILLEANTTI